MLEAQKKKSRRERDPEKIRTRELMIYLNEEEYATVAEAARISGSAASPFLRQLALKEARRLLRAV